MTPAEDRFATHLVDDESVRVLTTGTLLDDSTPGRVTVGLTDRRVLCVSNTGAFTDVRYEYISAVRSRPRTRLAYRYRTGDAVLAGATVGFLAAVGLFVAVGTAADVGLADASLTVGLAAVAAAAILSIRDVRTASGTGQANRQLFVGTGVLALVLVVVAALLVSSVSLSLFALATVGGLAVATVGPRWAVAFDGTGLYRRQQTQLTITTVDGRSIRLVTGPDAELGTELSRFLSRADSPAPSVPLTRSATE